MKLRVKKSSIGAVSLAAILAFTFNNAIAANDLMNRLDRDNKVKEKSYPTRLGDRKDRRCKACEERERDAKFEYLSRAIAAHSSSEYQTKVNSLILADEKFVKNCWSRLGKRDIEVFFTINEEGKAEDFAWFPNKTYGKCLSKHVTKIDFPKPEKVHYSWMVTSDTVVME